MSLFLKCGCDEKLANLPESVLFLLCIHSLCHNYGHSKFLTGAGHAAGSSG
jgi:hypothetical protein